MAAKFLAALLLAGLLSAATAGWAADAAPAGNIKRSAPVGLGDTLPDFTLEDQDGRTLTLSAEWKKQPVVLIFYRGNW